MRLFYMRFHELDEIMHIRVIIISPDNFIKRNFNF
jgi:hypothetical protein